MDTNNNHLQSPSSDGTANSVLGSSPGHAARSDEFSLVHVPNQLHILDSDFKVDEDDFLEEYKVKATKEVQRIAAKYNIYSTNPYSTYIIELLLCTEELEAEEVIRLKDALMCYPDSVKNHCYHYH